MKNVTKNVRTDELLVDVVEYAFIEWLVRRGIFVAYKSNFEYYFSPCKSFRDCLRSQIRRSLRDFGLDLSRLILISFWFAKTPEGDKFWVEQSAAWGRFCSKLQVKL